MAVYIKSIYFWRSYNGLAYFVKHFQLCVSCALDARILYETFIAIFILFYVHLSSSHAGCRIVTSNVVLCKCLPQWLEVSRTDWPKVWTKQNAIVIFPSHWQKSYKIHPINSCYFLQMSVKIKLYITNSRYGLNICTATKLHYKTLCTFLFLLPTMYSKTMRFHWDFLLNVSHSIKFSITKRDNTFNTGW